LARLNKAPIVIEAVARIDALFAIEREINGRPPDGRRKVLLWPSGGRYRPTPKAVMIRDRQRSYST
jgi:hypothetical protein